MKWLLSNVIQTRLGYHQIVNTSLPFKKPATALPPPPSKKESRRHLEEGVNHYFQKDCSSFSALAS